MTYANSIFTGSAGAFFLVVLYAAFSQNAVLGRALGSSRLIKLVSDEDGDAGIFSILLLTVQVLSGLFGWMANTWLLPLFGDDLRAHLRPLLMVACVSLVFFAVFVFVVEALPNTLARRVVRQLPIAAYNCCILGALLLTGTQNYTLSQTLAFCLGSALGFMGVILLMREGNRKLKKADLSIGFRGLPATLVYLGILSLMIYGFTGHGLAV